jgi:hypothetical protein
MIARIGRIQPIAPTGVAGVCIVSAAGELDTVGLALGVAEDGDELSPAGAVDPAGGAG